MMNKNITMLTRP